MSAREVWLLIAFLLLLALLLLYMELVKLSEKQLIKKCQNIWAPVGHEFLFRGVTRTKKGVVIDGIVIKPPAEGGVDVKFVVPDPRKLGYTLYVVLRPEGYRLLDFDHAVFY